MFTIQNIKIDSLENIQTIKQKSLALTGDNESLLRQAIGRKMLFLHIIREILRHSIFLQIDDNVKDQTFHNFLPLGLVIRIPRWFCMILKRVPACRMHEWGGNRDIKSRIIWLILVSSPSPIKPLLNDACCWNYCALSFRNCFIYLVLPCLSTKFCRNMLDNIVIPHFVNLMF